MDASYCNLLNAEDKTCKTNVHVCTQLQFSHDTTNTGVEHGCTGTLDIHQQPSEYLCVHSRKTDEGYDESSTWTDKYLVV